MPDRSIAGALTRLLKVTVRFSVPRSSDGTTAMPGGVLSVTFLISMFVSASILFPDMSANDPLSMSMRAGRGVHPPSVLLWVVVRLRTRVSPSATGRTAPPSAKVCIAPDDCLTVILVALTAEASTYSVKETASVPAAMLSTGCCDPSRTGFVVSFTTVRPPGNPSMNGLPERSSNTEGLASIRVASCTTAAAACPRVRLTMTVSVYLWPLGGGGCSTAAPPRTVLLTPVMSRSTIPHGRTFPTNSLSVTFSVPSFRSRTGPLTTDGLVVSAVTLSGNADRPGCALPDASENAPGGTVMRAAPIESARSVAFSVILTDGE